jgi:hypothetical protein
MVTINRRVFRQLVTGVVVVLVGMVVAACGGSNHPQANQVSSVDQYVAQVDRIYKPVVDDFNAAGDCAPPVKSASKCVAEDTKLIAAADALAQGLPGLNTPPQLVSARDELVKAAMTLSSVLRTRVKLLRKHDMDGYSTAEASVEDALGQFDVPISAMNLAGSVRQPCGPLPSILGCG